MAIIAAFDGCDVDAFVLEVLVGVQWVVGSAELVVWWTVRLLETRELLCLLHVALNLLVEVLLRELTIVWNPVVECSWLVVPQVLEAGHVRVTNEEWHISVAIIYSTKLPTLEVCLHIIFHNWCLGVGGMLSSSGLTINAITKSENVGESLVLESIWANVDHTVSTRDTGVDKLLVRHTIWVDVNVREWVLLSSAGINVLECANLLADGVSLNL